MRGTIARARAGHHIADIACGQPVVQRKLFIGKNPVNEETIDAVRQSVRREERAEPLLKGERNSPLYVALGRKAYADRKHRILDALSALVADDVDDEGRHPRTWLAAVLVASQHASAEAIPVAERAARARELAAMIGGLDDDAAVGGDGDEPRKRRRSRSRSPERGSRARSRSRERGSDTDDEVEFTATDLRRAASVATSGFFDEKKGTSMHIGIARRKQHAIGHTNFATSPATYGTYTGTIGPKPNAFVLGTLPDSYDELFTQLVAGIVADGAVISSSSSSADTAAAPAAAAAKPAAPKPKYDDRTVARLFLGELRGQDAFAVFSPKTQQIAHKILALLLHAEFSRHSIAPVAAMAVFHVVANRGDDEAKPTLAGAFGSGAEMRALYAGSGGAAALRGTAPDPKEQAARNALFEQDILKFYRDTAKKDETIEAFVQRRTFEVVLNTWAKIAPRVKKNALDTYARRGVPKSGQYADPVTTLQHLGFTRHVMGGEGNDCAINTLYDQLTRKGVAIPNQAAFAAYIRANAGLGAGAMIDILNSGPAFLRAALAYLATIGVALPGGITIDMWSATPEGLMEYRAVAHAAPPPAGGGGAAAAPAAPTFVTFFYNGHNHFDSLVGALAR
jgi:hypothetical protein